MPFRNFLVCLSLILTLSCNSNRDKNTFLNQSHSVVDQNPRLALSLTDSALRDIRNGQMNDRFAVPVLLVRQQAFSKLRMMDSVLSVGVEIRAIASSRGDSLSMAKSLLLIGGEVSMTDQQAFEPYLPGALSTFSKTGMIYEAALIESIIGGVAARKGDFNASMDHLYHARDVMERLDSIRPLYAIYMNIGNNRSGMGDQRAALEFYALATGIARRIKDSVRIATALMNEGIAYSDMNIFDSSRMRFNEGLSSLPAQYGELAGLQILFNMATLSEKQGNLEVAVADYGRVVDGARKLGDPVAIGMANASIAVLMSKTGRLAPGIRLLEETIGKLDSIGFRHYDAAFTTELIQLYKMADRCTDALRASEYLKRLSDSLLSTEKMKAIEELEGKYKFEKNDQEKRNLTQKLKINRLINIGIGLAALFFLIIGIIFRQRNRFQQDLLKSYERMMVRYRNERDAAENLKSPKYWDMQGETEADDPGDHTKGEEKSDSTTEEIIPTEEDNQVYSLLLSHLSEEKPYLNPRLKIEDVASHLGVSVRRLSQLIKAMSGQSFNNFINRFRIDEATRMLEDPKNLDWKIDVIADRSGFSSRQQFRRIFEQVTGVNPGFYRSRINNNQS
jgi:AraC-like DNA-binding protein